MRDGLANEELSFIHDRSVRESVPYLQPNPFVVMDNLSIITRLFSKKEQKILKNICATKQELISILAEKEI